MKTIEVFYKNKEPSLKTLEKANIVFDKYKDTYKYPIMLLQILLL